MHDTLLKASAAAPQARLSHQLKAWTHDLCVDAPYETSCWIRLYEGVFSPLP